MGIQHSQGNCKVTGNKPTLAELDGYAVLGISTKCLLEYVFDKIHLTGLVKKHKRYKT